MLVVRNMDEKLHKASISMVWHPPETNGDWTPKKRPHTQLSGEGRLCYPTPRGCTPAMVNSDRPVDSSALALFLLWASRPAAPSLRLLFLGQLTHSAPPCAWLSGSLPETPREITHASSWKSLKESQNLPAQKREFSLQLSPPNVFAEA